VAVETTIYTIRHTQTRYNGEKRYAGTIDVPLNEKGIRDARAASARLAGLTFDIVITSTLKRSIETAHLLVGDGDHVIKSALCNERSFGVMEGLTWDEVQNLEPRVLFIEVGNDLHSVNPQGGEPFEDVWERARKFRRFLFKEYRGSRILIVSHGVFLQMFHGLLRGLSCIESLAVYPSTLELTMFRFSGNRLVTEEAVSLAAAAEAQW
jgi:broad specificity phosphatase PhoE